MQHDGYVTLPTTSYAAWKAAVNGNGYNANQDQFGDQCWDLCAEFWYNIGFPQGYPSTGGTGAAYGCWDARTLNAANAFDLIYDKTKIKRGDVIVYNHFPGNDFGHIGFADEDYPGHDDIKILSQNNQGTPYAGGGKYTDVAPYTLQYFLGAFRYKGWQHSPYLTAQPPKRKKFPWVVYSRKLRNKY